MFKNCKVEEVKYSKLNNCVFVTYMDEGMKKCAACSEHLSVKCGDTVEVYSDDYLHYRGFSAIALKIA